MRELLSAIACALAVIIVVLALTSGDDLKPFRRGPELCTLKRAENPSALCEYTWCVQHDVNEPLLCYGQDGRAWSELFYDARRGFR